MPATTIGEFDRLLGDDLVPSDVVLVTDELGSGNSTLLTAQRRCPRHPKWADLPVLHISGERSAIQVRLHTEYIEALGP